MRLFYKSIWGTVVILNLQSDINTVHKYLETLGRKLLKEYIFMFYQWNLT